MKMKRYPYKSPNDVPSLATDVQHSSAHETRKVVENWGFTYAAPAGLDQGTLEACPRCGAVVLVGNGRDVMKNLAGVVAHVSWHDAIEPDDTPIVPAPLGEGQYKPPGVYCND